MGSLIPPYGEVIVVGCGEAEKLEPKGELHPKKVMLSCVVDLVGQQRRFVLEAAGL